jgi:hypothetical protein
MAGFRLPETHHAYVAAHDVADSVVDEYFAAQRATAQAEAAEGLAVAAAAVVEAPES